MIEGNMGTDLGLEDKVVLAKKGGQFPLEVPCAYHFPCLHRKRNLGCDHWGTQQL